MPDQDQINDDADIIEGEADILETPPAKPKAKSKKQTQQPFEHNATLPKPWRLRGLMALVLLAIAIGSFALYQTMTSTAQLSALQDKMTRLEQAQAIRSEEHQNQMQILLSERQADQTLITDLQNQLALVIEAQGQQSSQFNKDGSATGQSAMVAASMMWQVASDDRLILLSDMVTALPDSQMKTDLMDIIMLAENHDIASLVAQGQDLYQQQFETDDANEEAAGLLSSVRHWFADAVKLQSVSDSSEKPSPQRENSLTPPMISNDLSVLFEGLEAVPSAQIWREHVTLRLSLPHKIEQIIRQSFQNELSQP